MCDEGKAAVARRTRAVVVAAYLRPGLLGKTLIYDEVGGDLCASLRRSRRVWGPRSLSRSVPGLGCIRGKLSSRLVGVVGLFSSAGVRTAGSRPVPTVSAVADTNGVPGGTVAWSRWRGSLIILAVSAAGNTGGDPWLMWPMYFWLCR